MDRRIKILGRDVPVILLTIIAITSLASAALLSYYGGTVGEATVSQSVQLDGMTCEPTPENPLNGCTASHVASGVAGDVMWSDANPDQEENQSHILKNTAGVQAKVTLTSTEETDTIDTVEYWEAGNDGLCGTGDEGETQLSDEDTEVEGFQLILDPGEEIKLCFKYVFPINAEAGTYTITTTIEPVTTG